LKLAPYRKPQLREVAAALNETITSTTVHTSALHSKIMLEKKTAVELKNIPVQRCFISPGLVTVNPLIPHFPCPRKLQKYNHRNTMIKKNLIIGTVQGLENVLRFFLFLYIFYYRNLTNTNECVRNLDFCD